jgi:hypothetical protein
MPQHMERVQTEFGEVWMWEDQLQKIIRQELDGEITKEEAERRWLEITSPGTQSPWYRFLKRIFLKSE